MADDVDYAQERLELEMQARLSVAKRFNTPSLLECAMCGDDIPARRQDIGSVTRCIDCQTNYEVKNR